MKKRAVELSIQTIVVAVIALIVLVVVILVLRGQIGKTTKQYFGIGEQATAEANMTKCTTGLFVKRQCESSCSAIKDDYYWHSVGKLDCKTGICCERGELKPPSLRQKPESKTPAKK